MSETDGHAAVVRAIEKSEERLSGQIRAADERQTATLNRVEARMNEQVGVIQKDLNQLKVQVAEKVSELSARQTAAVRDCHGRHERTNGAAESATRLAAQGKAIASKTASRVDSLEAEDGPVKRNERAINLIQSRTIKVGLAMLTGGGTGVGISKLIEWLT